MKKHENISSQIFDVFNVLIMLFVCMITVYPLIYLVSKSFSSTEFVKANMVYLFPRGFNIEAYKEAINNALFWVAYKNTVIYTVFGTFVNLAMTVSLAYGLSRPYLIFHKQITFLIILTMFFSGGLIPGFILVKTLKIYNTIWAVILPGAISTYNMIIVRTYIKSLPESIIESVRVDGGNDLQIFFKIIIPLSMPVIATIGLFYAVGHWNSYFSAMIYLKDTSKYPVQLVLKEMIVDQNLQGMSNIVTENDAMQRPTSEMLTAASIVIVVLPMLVIYPFVQRFFVKGVMIGSVKG